MNLAPGPGWIMHLKISGSFLQPFSTFRKDFLRRFIGSHVRWWFTVDRENKESMTISFLMQGTTADNAHLS